MLRLLLFHASYCTLHFMHYIILPLAHIRLFYVLDQVQGEPEAKVRAERVQVEDLTNLALDKGKPRCI
jgi:hypothetical protein